MLDLKNFDGNYICKCGKTHRTLSRIVYGEAFCCLKNELKSLYKAGGVLFLYEEYVDFSEFEKVLKDCGGDYAFSVEKIEGDEKGFKYIDGVPEEIRFCVCVGGEKALRTVKKLKLDFIFIPTRLGNLYLDDVVYVQECFGLTVSHCKAPKALIVDENLLKKYKTRDNVAYGYSLLVGAKLYLSEMLFSFGRGEEVCPFIFDELKSACATDFSVTFFEESFVTELMEKLLKISLFRQMSGTFSKDTLLLFSEVLARSNPELEKACCIGGIIYLYYTYTKTLGVQTPFYVISESRETVAFQMAEVMGFDYEKYLLNTPLISVEDVLFSEYCLKGVSSGISETLGSTTELSSSIFYVKKIMTDGGYSLKKLCVNDLNDVLCYTAELSEPNSFLKYCYLQGLVKLGSLFK